MKSRTGNLLLLAGSVVASLLLAEVALRFSIPLPSRYDVWEPGLRIAFRPIPGVMPGVSGDSRFFVNSEGVRGDEPSPEHRLALLALGGSTTECLYLDQDEAWPARLQALLTRHHGYPVRVGNAGRSGMTTRDNLLHVRYLLPRFDQVSVLLVLAGINDLALRLEQGDAYDPDPPDSPEHAFSLLAPETVPLWQRTGLGRLWMRIQAKRQELARGRIIYSIGGDSYQEWRQRRRAASRWREALPDLSAGLNAYEANLLAMAGLARQAGKKIVFMTQPALWRSDLSREEEDLLWFGWVGDRTASATGEYYTTAALRAGLDAYNERLLAVCDRADLDCLDLAAPIPRSVAAFYDDVHFNEKGSALAAQVIFEHLVRD